MSQPSVNRCYAWMASLACALLATVAGAAEAPAAEPSFVLPLELVTAGAEPRREAVVAELQARAWTWSERAGLLVARAPLRAAAGAVDPPPTVHQALATALELLTPEERAAVVGGRWLRLDRVSPAAGAMLRALMPSAHRLVASPTRPDNDTGRRVRLPALPDGQAITAEEEARLRGGLAAEARVRWELARLDWIPVFGVRPRAVIEIRDNTGRSVAADVPLVGAAGPPPDFLTAWDERSLVGAAVPVVGSTFAALIDSQPLAGRRDGTVKIPTDGLYTLADLAAMLSAWRPHRVAEPLADERLYMSAGDYEAGFVEEAVQRASGLVWQPGPDGLLLDFYQPPAPLLDAAPSTLFAELVGHDLGDSPFDIPTLAATPRAERTMPVWLLDDEARQWLTQRARRVEQTSPGSTLQMPGAAPAAAVAQAWATAKLSVAWQFGTYAPWPAGEPGTWCRLGSTGYVLAVGEE